MPQLPSGLGNNDDDESNNIKTKKPNNPLKPHSTVRNNSLNAKPLIQK